MKKLMNKKGFTLMEMLIVVAIIVILVAISIPVFTSQLNAANEATDKANLRAAKAAAIAEYMLNNKDADESNDIESGEYYNVEDGSFGEKPSTPYGKSGSNKYIVVTITGESVSVAWTTQ